MTNQPLNTPIFTSPLRWYTLNLIPQQLPREIIQTLPLQLSQHGRTRQTGTEGDHPDTGPGEVAGVAERAAQTHREVFGAHVDGTTPRFLEDQC